MTLIVALDLGVRMGMAFGEARPGVIPSSRAILLKDRGEHRSTAFSNLICVLTERFNAARPALLVKEKMLPLQAFRTLGNAEATVRLTSGLHAVTEAVCVRYGVRFEDVADSTVRKHFIGRARMGTREATKAAVVQRAQLLKYMPRDCTDNDRADALAIWDFAAATYGRASGGNLHLFGEAA